MTDLKKVLLTGVIAVSLLLTTNAFAGVPWAKFTYFQNWGGLNDNLSSTEIADNEASDIQNVVFDTGGAIKKRFGYKNIPSAAPFQVVTSSNIAITGLAFYKQADGDRFLVATVNDDGTFKVYKKDYQVGGGWESGAWESITSGSILNFNNDYLTSFSVAEDNLIITTFTTTGVTPMKWGGSGNTQNLTTDADCPKSTLNIYHKNHLFTNDFTNKSRIWFSALDDITNFTATDFIDIQTNDGTQVRGMVSALDSLYIFKDKSIWRLSGDDRDSWILEKMVDGVGTLSHQSIAVVGNLIYFTTQQNDIAVYTGGYDVGFISQKIRNTISGLNFSRASTNLGIAFSTYKYADYDYYAAVSASGSAENNRVLLFDTAYKAWTKFVGLNPNAWCVAEDSNGQNTLVFGDYDGYVYYYPSTTYYDGDITTSSINSFYQTKWFKYSDLALGDKYWRKLKTYALTENVSNNYLMANAKSDYESTGKEILINITQSGSLWNNMIWDTDSWAGQSLVVDTQEIEKGKSMFQLKYSNSDVDEGFTIFGWEMFVEPTDRI